MRILFFQHGDYRETVQHYAAGGGETYYAQRYSVDAVADLAREAEEVCVACVTAGPYDEMLSNGVRAIGVPAHVGSRFDQRPMVDLLEQFRPTHLIPRFPATTLLREAAGRKMRVLPMLADSFESKLRQWWRHRQLASVLNRPEIEWVGNHNINAARSLQQIGVEAGKIIPWDWPPGKRPEDSAPKSLPDGEQGGRILYVGVISRGKGVGDAIDAVSLLRSCGREVSLTAVGPGDQEPFLQMAREGGIGEHVRFTGRIDHAQVLDMMRDCDLVVVPSRHEYPEGLPFTIYDAYISRTPLVVSDHPMFRGKVEDGKSGLIFEAGDKGSLADSVERLLGNPDLYRRLSENAVEAFERIECPAKWDEILRRWLRDDDADRQWLAAHSLGSGRYDA